MSAAGEKCVTDAGLIFLLEEFATSDIEPTPGEWEYQRELNRMAAKRLRELTTSQEKS